MVIYFFAMRRLATTFARTLLAASILALLPAPAHAADAPGKGAARPAPRPTLVFFMNPAGRPCQTQDQILAESRARWDSLATLRYARTDVEADRALFYQYGVRSLPSLILVGPDGKELYRYSPGIQPADTVLAGLRSHPGR